MSSDIFFLSKSKNKIKVKIKLQLSHVPKYHFKSYYYATPENMVLVVETILVLSLESCSIFRRLLIHINRC